MLYAILCAIQLIIRGTYFSRLYGRRLCHGSCQTQRYLIKIYFTNTIFMHSFKSVVVFFSLARFASFVFACCIKNRMICGQEDYALLKMPLKFNRLTESCIRCLIFILPSRHERTSSGANQKQKQKVEAGDHLPFSPTQFTRYAYGIYHITHNKKRSSLNKEKRNEHIVVTKSPSISQQQILPNSLRIFYFEILSLWA